ncbi:MAG: alanine dehydrogenase [Bacteroidetes bacterium]|nr:alanine dehydrogenase [Bacteroidota bacterium]
MKIGIIKEGKIPPDSRVPLTPLQCKQAMVEFPIEIVVESCPTRCYKDEEYQEAGIKVTNDIRDCDVLMGVKEVPISQLVPNKTYFFFSHTIKKQPYNRKLLWAILDKKIRLIDYEVLKDETGNRLIAFGRFAGMVGAHNAIWTFGQRHKAFSLPRMKDFHDYQEAKDFYQAISLPAIKIVLTGHGRVANGAADVLRDMGVQEISPADFLEKTFQKPVFTQISSQDYVAKKNERAFVKREFYEHPERFKSIFSKFYKVADVMINGIFWNNSAPAFFSKAEMASPDFHIQVIADVTCDIAPVSSIPSTIKASTIADPVFGFNPKTSEETAPFLTDSVDMMTIDNLPNEMPRDASMAFGKMFLQHIMPQLLKSKSVVIENGTIAKDGHLTRHFRYLNDYVNGAVVEGIIA